MSSPSSELGMQLQKLGRHFFLYLKNASLRRPVSSTKGAAKTGHPHAKKMSLDLDLTSSTKMNSKWITDVNTKLGN